VAVREILTDPAWWWWGVVAVVVAWTALDRRGWGPAALRRTLVVHRGARWGLWLGWAWLGWHLFVR